MPGKADLAKLEKGIKAGKLPADAKFALQTPSFNALLEPAVSDHGVEANQIGLQRCFGST